LGEWRFFVEESGGRVCFVEERGREEMGFFGFKEGANVKI
jgi:hypothetical protein